METTRVLIVEDEPLWSDLLARTLATQPGVEVVGKARDGETAVQMMRDLRPDAVLMDIELAGEMDGIEAAIKIKAERPKTGIVVLSSHNERRYITSLPLGEKPGWSYLLKQTVPDIETVLRAIQSAMNGMLMVDPGVVASLRPRKASALTRLTNRQKDVLQLIAEGYNNAAIAARLVLTVKSVETYINGLYDELGVSGAPGIHARVKAAMIYLQESRAMAVA